MFIKAIFAFFFLISSVLLMGCWLLEQAKPTLGIAATVILGIILMSGCSSTPLTADQQYKRDDHEVLRLEKFYEYRNACVRRGGIIQIDRRTSSPKYCRWRECPPKSGDNYICMN